MSSPNITNDDLVTAEPESISTDLIEGIGNTPAAKAEPQRTNLLDSAPEFVQSRETFARINTLRTYRGPTRGEISDADWDVVRAALKHLASHCSEYNTDDYGFDEVVIDIVQSLSSLSDSRPAERIYHEYCERTNYLLGVEQWSEWKGRPKDLAGLIQLSYAYGWPASFDPTPIPCSRFQPVTPDLNAPRPKWLVKGILLERSLAVLFGKWGTGKSTIAVELCGAIAQGKSWHGRKVQQGTAVYIASENAHGFRMRVDALLRDQGVTLDSLGGRFLEITGRPHLLKPAEVKELISELKTFGPISLVVVDTYARATAGVDENASQDVGVLVENCQTLANDTGAAVMLVHHTGKDESRGMRGSSSLPAAADTEIILERPNEAENLRTARIGKQRDAADHCDLFNYELKVVELGVDEDGEKFTSTAVHEVEAGRPSCVVTTELPKSPIRRAIRCVLGDAMRPMRFDELIRLAMSRLVPPDPGKRDQRRGRLKLAAERMVADRELYIDEHEMCSLLQPAMPFVPVAADTAANDDLTGGDPGT